MPRAVAEPARGGSDDAEAEAPRDSLVELYSGALSPGADEASTIPASREGVPPTLWYGDVAAASDGDDGGEARDSLVDQYSESLSPLADKASTIFSPDSQRQQRGGGGGGTRSTLRYRSLTELTCRTRRTKYAAEAPDSPGALESDAEAPAVDVDDAGGDAPPRRAEARGLRVDVGVPAARARRAVASPGYPVGAGRPLA